MSQFRLVPLAGQQALLPGMASVPSLFLDKPSTYFKMVEFLTARIRNPNTREAYGRAVSQFSRWCESHRLALPQLSPFLIAGYIEELQTRLSKPSVKQHLAGIRVLFDYLVVSQILPANPAASVKGPKYQVHKGKTPVLSAEEARKLLESIDISTPAGLRDRALIGGMLFSFARVGAMLGMNVDDYFEQGKTAWFRLNEKGGKVHDVPVHHKAREFLDAYVSSLGIWAQPKTPLFRVLDADGQTTSIRLDRKAALAMVKRRARKAGLSPRICNHSFRATGITTYLLNKGTLEQAQRIAAHSSPKTTKLYDRTSDKITIDEIERIIF